MIRMSLENPDLAETLNSSLDRMVEGDEVNFISMINALNDMVIQPGSQTNRNRMMSQEVNLLTPTSAELDEGSGETQRGQ